MPLQRLLPFPRLQTSGRGASHPRYPFRSGACGLRHIVSSSFTRVYAYEVDEHGQVFLSGTKHRNFTSCYKDRLFLDVLLGKLRPNKPAEPDPTHQNLQRQEYLANGYRWVSRCGSELNFVKADCTPIVYQDLDSHNQLSYAGTLTTSFQPDALRVDTTTGYIFHPSPGRKGRYGKFSLLRSSLVLDRLGASLVLADEAQDRHPIGWLEWEGSRFPIGCLQRRDTDWVPEQA